MYKFIPQFSSRLVAGLAASATSMQLTPADAAFLTAQLAGGKWTYVAFAEGPDREVVRITSVSGPYASIVRGLDGTTARDWYINDCFTSVLGPSAVLDLVTQAAVDTALNITGTGAATVTQPTPRNFIVNVPAVGITACEDPAVEVLGTFPNFEICIDRGALGANCGGGLPSDPFPVPNVEDFIKGSGATSVTFDSGTGSYLIHSDFVTITGGTDITVTGSYPNFTISYSGTVGGSGTVTSVSGGAGIIVTGVPTITPVVGLTSTGVVAGDYAGTVISAQGRISAIPVAPGPDSGPIMVAALDGSLETLASLQLTRVGHTVTFRVLPASTAVDGWGVVRLAPATAADSRTPLDSSRAVTPAGLDAVLAVFEAGSPAGLAGASSGESSGLYSVTAASTAVTVPTGYALLVFATAIAVHGTSPATTLGEFGIAIFADTVFNTGTRIVPGNSHSLMTKITTTGVVTLELKHTALGAGFSLSTGQISYILVKA